MNVEGGQRRENAVLGRSLEVKQAKTMGLTAQLFQEVVGR